MTTKMKSKPKLKKQKIEYFLVDRTAGKKFRIDAKDGEILIDGHQYSIEIHQTNATKIETFIRRAPSFRQNNSGRVFFSDDKVGE